MQGPRARVRPRRLLGLVVGLGPFLLLLQSPPASCQLPRQGGEAYQLQQGLWQQQQQQLGPTARLYPSNVAQPAQSIGGAPDKQRQLPPNVSRAQSFHQQPRHHHHHHQQQQQQHPLEYYDDDYYDEPEPAPLPLQREPKTAYSVNANSNPIYDDSYYYDDDYEEEPPKPGIKGQSKGDPPDKQEKQEKKKQLKESAPSEVPATSSTSTSPSTSTTPATSTTTTKTTTTTTTTTTTPSTTTSTTTEQPERTSKESILIGEAIVSVVTTKSVVNGTYSIPESTTSQPFTESTEPTSSSTSTSTQGTTSTSTEPTTSTTTTTEQSTRPSSTTIQPSVQTGRSVSGARFLPFPSVVDKVEQLDSTESINDKLDRVQSELSSGFLANNRFVPRRYNKKPFSVTSLTLPTTSTTLAPTSSPIAPIAITSIATKRPRAQTTIDDIEAFLPKDYTRRGPTTLTPPVITKRPKLQTTLEDVEAFLPKDYPRGGFSTSSTSSTSTTSTKASGGTTKRPRLQTTLDDLEAFLPKDYKSSYRNKRPGYKTTSTTTTTTSTTEASTAQVALASSTERSRASTRPKTLTTIEDIAAFLPPGYKLKKEDATTEKSVILSEILAKTKIAESKEGSAVTTSTSTTTTTEKAKSIQDLFAKSQVDISALLPPGYEPEASSPKPEDTKPSDDPISKLLEKSAVDISALLPPGFKPDGDKAKSTKEVKSEVEVSTSSEKAINEEAVGKGGQQQFKVVFPSRPGGRKPLPKTGSGAAGVNRPSAAETTPAPKIQKGWPTRATTEFTGWPTSSTTPISIEKLLEAARTATIGSIDVSHAQPTTSEASSLPSSSTTTSTTTLRPTTPGICDEGCEVAGTIRIVENAEWLPELLDRNTREWQELAEDIEREMNAVFRKSSVLRKWYRNIRIDSFSQGSVLVDYFVELADMKEKIDTQQLKLLFHDSVRTINSDDPMDLGTKGPMKLGKFTIDPRSTDFVVIPRVAAPKISDDDNRLIPQWAIAMIVMGVGGLLFTIVFGVSVLVNRQQGSKLKPSITAMFEEEAAKNAAAAAAASMAHHGSHSPSSRPSSSDYHKSHTMWSDAGWHDKPFESSSHKILVDGPAYERKYNMYDSWKSEWNGYYYHPTHAGGSNYSRHHPDYDMNF